MTGTALEDPCTMAVGGPGGVWGCAPLLERKLRAGKASATVGKDPDSQAANGRPPAPATNTGPSLFKNGGEEGDKGNQNLRQIGVITKYQG